MFGIRKALREFHNLWAVGSMLGSTQTVDMEATRKSDFGRIMVAVLNPLLIPAHLDVVIGDHYFELEFQVEKLGVDEYGEEMSVDWKGHDGEGEGREWDYSDSNPEETREPKRKKNSDEPGKEAKGQDTENGQQVSDSVSNLNLFKEKVLDMTEENFSAFLRKKADQILDKAVDQALDVIVDQVLAEKEEDLLTQDNNVEGAEISKGESEKEKLPDLEGNSEARAPDFSLTEFVPDQGEVREKNFQAAEKCWSLLLEPAQDLQIQVMSMCC